MKPTNATLNSILAGRQFYIADLITFTLQDGTVLQYCSGQADITSTAGTFISGGAVGPYFDRKDNKAKVVWNLGVGTDTLVIDVLPGSTSSTVNQVEGHSWWDAVRLGLFDGADFELDRAYMTPPQSAQSLARHFDGASQQLHTAENPNGLSQLSVAVWFNADTLGGGHNFRLAATDHTDVNANGFQMYLVSGGGSVKLDIETSTGLVQVSGAQAWSTGAWTHFAFTYDGANFKLFWNGSSIASAAATGTIKDGSSFGLTFSGYPAGVGLGFTDSFVGALSDMAVWNTGLTSTQVSQLSGGARANTVSTSSIIDYYPITGASPEPDTVGSNNATLVGSPTVVSGPLAALITGGYGNVSAGCAPMLFKGRVAEVEADRAIITFSINDYRELLNQQMPRWLYAASCQNALYDASCTLLSTNFQSTGSVGAGSSFSFIINTTLAQASGYFDLGKIKFTSGNNNGLVFPISSWSSSLQTITLAAQTPFIPVASDQFTIFPGCDLSTGSGGCGKFSNIANFRGMPYIPDPGQAI